MIDPASGQTLQPILGPQPVPGAQPAAPAGSSRPQGLEPIRESAPGNRSVDDGNTRRPASSAGSGGRIIDLRV